MTLIANKDFKQRVQEGLVPGYSIMKALGEREGIDTNAAGHDVWRSNDFTPVGPLRMKNINPAGIQVSFVSESNEDGAGGSTGVLSVRIEYIKVDGTQATEDVTLNGTTPVNSSATDIIFINDFYALTIGSNGVSVGSIAAYEAGGSIEADLISMIALGGNKLLCPHRMVPANHELHLKGWSPISSNNRVSFRIRSTDIKGVLLPPYIFKGVAYVTQGAGAGEIPLDDVIPALSIVKVTGWGDQANCEGSVSWWGYLKQLS